MAVHLNTTAETDATPGVARRGTGGVMSALTLSRRSGWALVTSLLIAAVGFEATRHGLWWPTLAGLILPDLALAFGAGKGLAHGQLHPRAVPLYNAVHSFWAPVALIALASADLIGLAWLVAGLAWATHVALDRAVGYGLRDRRGFQRGA
jgi:hypothetical protein